MSIAPRAIRRVVLAGAALTLVAFTTGELPTAAAAAPTKLTVAAPVQDALVTGKRLRVRVRGVRARFRALLGSRDVTSRFGRARRGVRTAVLRRGRDFRAGSNRLVVRAGGRNLARSFVAGKRKRGSLRVQRMGRRSGCHLRVRGPKRGFEHLHIYLNGGRVRGRDWRVGPRSSASEWPLAQRRFRVMLGAHHGLRYGVNRVRLVAWRADGTFDRVVHRMRIPRSRAPLASARGGRRTATGRRVVLDGRKTRARGAEVRSRWRIVRTPKGSKAKLRRPRSLRPRLVPDVPGTYRIRHTARARPDSASSSRAPARASGRAQPSAPPTPDPAGVDETTVEATPSTSPIGTPIETIGSDGGIEFLGESYTVPEGGWAQLLVLDRTTLEQVDYKSFNFTLADIRNLYYALLQLDSTKLIVITGGTRSVNPPNCLAFPHCEAMLRSVFWQAGAGSQYSAWDYDTRNSILASGRWSVIGVPGANGSAHTNLFGAVTGGPRGQIGSLSGYLQADSARNYGFVSPEATTIDTNAEGAPPGANRIRIGPDSYDSSPLAQGDSGFHVLVLDSQLRPAATVANPNQTFATTCGPDCERTSTVDAMTAMLSSVASSPDYLVIVQSIGQPSGSTTAWVDDGGLLTRKIGSRGFGDQMNALLPNDASLWDSPGGGRSLADAVGRLGGAEAHDQVAQMVAPEPQPSPASRQGYTLVASTGMLDFAGDPVDPSSLPVSRSQQLSNAPQARVGGSLRRDRQSLWHVGIGSAVPGPGSGSVAELAYQEPTAWPLSSTPGQKAASAYIARQLDLRAGDVRAAYYGPSGVDWTAKKDQLAGLSYPGIQHGFTKATFIALKQQLSDEMPMVANVMGLIQDWQAVWTSATVGNSLDLQSIATDILVDIEKLQQQAQSSAASAEYIISDVLWVADALAPEVPGAAVGIETAAATLDLVGDSTTDPSGAPSTLPVQAEASQLGATLANRFEAIESNLSRLGDILVSDWGKLQQASKNASGDWAFARSTMVNALSLSAKREFYTALLASTYRIYVVDPAWLMDDPSQNTPQEIECFGDNAERTDPLGNASSNPASWLTRPPKPGALMWFGLQTEAQGDGRKMTHNPDAVPQSTSGPLFQPLASSSDALGIDKVSFFADSRFKRYWFHCNKWIQREDNPAWPHGALR